MLVRISIVALGILTTALARSPEAPAPTPVSAPVTQDLAYDLQLAKGQVLTTETLTSSIN